MERIVVGLDGSEAASAALAFAVAEARLRGAQVDAVIAWHEPYVAPTMTPVVADPAVFEESAERALDRALEGVDQSGEPVKIERRVVHGSAAGVLLEAAEGATMLVVGSRGRGGFAGLLLGSVSQQVVHHATCPVVIIPTHR
jgi:nucleotide-binding universal stress UspA family protein